MESRSKQSYQLSLYDFIKFDILVACPSCAQKAIVKVGQGDLQEDVKVVCTACGYHKKHSDSSKKPQSYTLGAAIDPFFKLPVWLQIGFEENTLWAYNHEHLNVLMAHVSAKLRERNIQETSNQSIGSRLPRWMTSQKNREAILKKMVELQHK